MVFRAAAYTQLQNYTEAIADCNRSIEIDPNYSKAYSRLGFAYYEQGEYSDAISKGFLKGVHFITIMNSQRKILISVRALNFEPVFIEGTLLERIKLSKCSGYCLENSLCYFGLIWLMVRCNYKI